MSFSILSDPGVDFQVNSGQICTYVSSRARHEVLADFVRLSVFFCVVLDTFDTLLFFVFSDRIGDRKLLSRIEVTESLLTL